MDEFAARRFDQLEDRLEWARWPGRSLGLRFPACSSQLQLPEAAQVISEHRLLRKVWQIAGLVDVKHRAPASGGSSSAEMGFGFPESGARIGYFHGLVLGDRTL